VTECERVRERWLDDDPDRDGLRRHVAACTDCLRFTSERERLRAAYRDLLEQDVPEELAATLRTEARRGTAPPARRRYVLVAAAAVVLACAGRLLLGAGERTVADWRRLAERQVEAGELEAAEVSLRQALDASVAGTERLEVQHELGLLAFRRGRFEAASSYLSVWLSELPRDDPGRKEGLLLLGEARELGGDAYGALGAFSEYQEAYPGDAEALRERVGNLRERVRQEFGEDLRAFKNPLRALGYLGY